jgi:hypothetical protein
MRYAVCTLYRHAYIRTYGMTCIPFKTYIRTKVHALQHLHKLHSLRHACVHMYMPEQPTCMRAIRTSVTYGNMDTWVSARCMLTCMRYRNACAQHLSITPAVKCVPLCTYHVIMRCVHVTARAAISFTLNNTIAILMGYRSCNTYGCGNHGT